MYPPHQGHGMSMRSTSPVRPHPPTMHGGAEGEGEAQRLRNELLHKDQVLKQLEVQFDLYKEEHAKLLASKIEEQREAFNLEKDRINQHFIKTGQELHGKTEELYNSQQEATKLEHENKMLKQWLDRGVEECRRVAEENEKMKNDIWDAKSALAKAEADTNAKVSVAESERDKERAEKEAGLAALQALQERVREMEMNAEEDRRNFNEITTQSRRMKRRMQQLKAVIDRFCGERPNDPLALDDGEFAALDDMHENTPQVSERQNARDSLFHVHEALNNLQASCKKLLQYDTAHQHNYNEDGNQAPGMFAMKHYNESLQHEHEALAAKLKRKERELEEMEEMIQYQKQRSDQSRMELEAELDDTRKQKNTAILDCDQARNEVNRLRDELEQTRISMNRVVEQDEASQRRAADLEEDLRKLTQEMVRIRDYGLQSEQQQQALERQLQDQRDAAEREEGQSLHRATQQAEQLRRMEEQMRQLQDQIAALQDEILDVKQSKAAADGKNIGLESQVESLQKQIANTEQRLSQAEQQRDQLRHELDRHRNASANTTPPYQAIVPLHSAANQTQPPGQYFSKPAQTSPLIPAPSVASINNAAITPQKSAPGYPGSIMPASADPEDFGHASSSHVKLSCPLCGTTGFVPGVPCRNCGHSVGQFTRLQPDSTYQPPMPFQPPSHAAPPQGQMSVLQAAAAAPPQRPPSRGGSAMGPGPVSSNISPSRWH
eukprot:TRINITY_DN24827_c0_g1_i1.p1 TRINITY_DN24827_c0_g1~~TRINITY_DN24827_c0_g1_i1.p1  ORF type:complete len:720 (+),score=279.68 TRINITY_DN24827_c0_g1_i1:70-2229(+)